MYILEIILKVINKLATVLHLPKDKLRRDLCAVLAKRIEVSDTHICLDAMTDTDLGPLLTATPPPPVLWELRM
jgi:hypothetical protein